MFDSKPKASREWLARMRSRGTPRDEDIKPMPRYEIHGPPICDKQICLHFIASVLIMNRIHEIDRFTTARSKTMEMLKRILIDIGMNSSKDFEQVDTMDVKRWTEHVSAKASDADENVDHCKAIVTELHEGFSKLQHEDETVQIKMLHASGQFMPYPVYEKLLHMHHGNSKLWECLLDELQTKYAQFCMNEILPYVTRSILMKVLTSLTSYPDVPRKKHSQFIELLGSRLNASPEETEIFQECLVQCAGIVNMLAEEYNWIIDGTTTYAVTKTIREGSTLTQCRPLAKTSTMYLSVFLDLLPYYSSEYDEYCRQHANDALEHIKERLRGAFSSWRELLYHVEGLVTINAEKMMGEIKKVLTLSILDDREVHPMFLVNLTRMLHRKHHRITKIREQLVDRQQKLDAALRLTKVQSNAEREHHVRNTQLSTKKKDKNKVQDRSPTVETIIGRASYFVTYECTSTCEIVLGYFFTCIERGIEELTTHFSSTAYVKYLDFENNYASKKKEIEELNKQNESFRKSLLSSDNGKFQIRQELDKWDYDLQKARIECTQEWEKGFDNWQTPLLTEAVLDRVKPKDGMFYTMKRVWEYIVEPHKDMEVNFGQEKNTLKEFVIENIKAGVEERIDDLFSKFKTNPKK